MLKQVIVICCLLLAVASCNTRPEGVLTSEKMEDVLLDISQAEAYSVQSGDNNHMAGLKNLDSLSKYYNLIFKKHNITPEQYAKSMDYYRKNPTELDSMFSHISDKAGKIQRSLSQNHKL